MIQFKVGDKFRRTKVGYSTPIGYEATIKDVGAVSITDDKGLYHLKTSIELVTSPSLADLIAEKEKAIAEATSIINAAKAEIVRIKTDNIKVGQIWAGDGIREFQIKFIAEDGMIFSQSCDGHLRSLCQDREGSGPHKLPFIERFKYIRG